MAQPDRKEVLAKADILKGKYKALPWDVSEKSLNKTFVFKEFTEAFAFMTEVAKIAEELDHHPDWSNSWNTVEISITNHQAGGITEVDLYMCARIEETAKRWGNKRKQSCNRNGSSFGNRCCLNTPLNRY